MVARRTKNQKSGPLRQRCGGVIDDARCPAAVKAEGWAGERSYAEESAMLAGAS
jgi:hypothetical protein